MRTTISLLPSEILYSQDTILCYFDARGAYSHQKIGETLDDICEGRCSIYAIPRIRVAKDGNRWVTADNRRLWIFKHLERLGKCRHIQVNVIDYIKPEKRNSTSGGMSVRIRGGDPGGYWHKRQPESQTFGTSNFGRSPASPSHGNTESDGSGIIIGLLVAGAALVCSFLFGR